jgi:hypothetical protein
VSTQKPEQPEAFVNPGRPDTPASTNLLLPKDVAEFMRDPTHTAVHNFVGSKMQIFQMTALATAGGIRAKDLANDHVIKVRLWYMHWVEMESRQGGTTSDNIRTALIDVNNEVYGFVSAGIAQSVLMIAESFGCIPYNPPIEMMVRKMETRKGMNMLTLIPVMT